MSFVQKKNKEVIDYVNELSDVGENEDTDVKMEREKVKSIITSNNRSNTPPPVVMVQNLHKEYLKADVKDCELFCCCKRDEETGQQSSPTSTKVAIKSLSLSVDAGEVFGLLGHNGAGKTTTMKIITGEEASTRGRVYIGGTSITSNLSDAFKLLGYCPQHDALWKNITVREHLECYAAIRGVPHSHISG